MNKKIMVKLNIEDKKEGSKMNILLLGLPGAGKGTHAKRLIKEYDMIHISSGNMFKKAVKQKTPLGVVTRKYFAKGRLVPDEITVKLMRKKLIKYQEKDIILDGFPRTMDQVANLENIMDDIKKDLDLCIYLDVDEKNLIKRATGRRICNNDGSIYHVEFNPPQKEGICDECGGELYQREDDKEEIVEKRIEENRENTEGIVDYYEKKGILETVEGTDRMPDEVHADIVNIMDDYLEKQEKS